LQIVTALTRPRLVAAYTILVSCHLFAQFGVVLILCQFYDYLLTVRWELEVIWLRSWSYTKVLFLLTRYLPFASVYFVIHSGFGRGCWGEDTDRFSNVPAVR
jgi:hypothetical protein